MHPSPLSLSLKSLFVHSSPCHLSSHSPPSLILTHKLACLPTSSPRNFSFFSSQCESVSPLHLPSKYLQFLSSAALGSLRGSLCLWRYADRLVYFLFFIFFFEGHVCADRRWVNVIKARCTGGKNGEGDGWEGKKKGVEMTRDAFLCTFVSQNRQGCARRGMIFIYLFIFYIKETRKTLPIYTSFWVRAAGGSFAGQKLVTRCTRERKTF